jgi:hypothetical protein
MNTWQKVQTAWTCLGLLGEIIRLINHAIEAAQAEKRAAAALPSSGPLVSPPPFQAPGPAMKPLGQLGKWGKVQKHIDRVIERS